MNESLKFLKAIFSFKSFFPQVFSSFFELTIQRCLFGKLNVCKTCKPCPFGPFAPILFFRRDYTENFAPIGPSWALAHIQTAVPKLPGVWYMHLGLDFYRGSILLDIPSCRLKRLSLFCDKFFARHERQNQEGKHVGMLSVFQRQLVAVDGVLSSTNACAVLFSMF